MNNQLKYLLFLMLVPLFLLAQEGISDGQELITNNSFDDGLTNWNLYVNSVCDATVDIDSTNQLTGEKSAHIRVNTLSGSTKRDYHIQFYQNIADTNGIRPGYKYYLQYKIKVSKAIDDFTVKVHMAHTPWLALEPNNDYLGRSLEANNSILIKDNFEFTDTDNKVKLSFDIGLISDADVDIWIDEVHLIEVKKEEVTEDDRRKDLPDGTELLTNNYFDNDLTNWELFSLESSRAEYELDTNSVITGKNSAHITVHNPYKDIPSGRIQLNQHNIPGGVIEGKYYFVSFNLKANKDIEKCFWTIYDEPDYQNWYNWDWVKVKKDSLTHFSFRFKANKTDQSVYFAIDFAALRNDNTEIWIDDFHLIAVSDPITEHPLPHEGIELLNNNYFNEGLKNWEIIANEDAAEISINPNYILEGENSVYIKINKTSVDNPEQTRLYQNNLLDSVKVGKKYYIQFIAKATKAVSDLYLSINQQNSPNETLYSKEISLPENEIVFITDTISFSSNEMVSWSFNLGTISKDSVEIWFDAVHLMELGEIKEPIFPPETTWNPVSPVTLEKPKYLQSVRDTKHGVDYTRISDPDAFEVSSGSGVLLSNYPKIQAWNVDMSLISLAFGTYLLDGENYSIYKKTSTSLYERRWSNVKPDIAYFCSGNQFKKINIETEEITTLHTFQGYKATIGPWEGSISADDKYVVITNESGGVPVEASLYDIEANNVISTKSFSGDIDWITITPSGNYIVVNDRGNQNMDVYDLNFNYLRTVGIGSQHGDFGVDSEGNEVWVQVIPLSMARLSDGKYTRLLQPNIGGHISGRGFNNPGWALVSTDINGEFNYTTQLFEIKLDGSGTIRHFGYARTSCTTYENYPMGSVSRDGKRVIFNSDWKYGTGSGGDAVAYISEYKERTTDVEESNNSFSNINFKLSQNYPNPFNPTTVINFILNKEGMTKLVVYNVLGQQVKVLINEHMQAGSYSTPFDASNLTSGVYFYKLQSNNQVEVKKMLLLK